MSEPMKYPGVGTGVWIKNDRKFLIGKRIGKTGANMWCPPGGKLELWEEWENHVRREVMEECGLQIQNIRLITLTNDMTPEVGTHFVTLHYAADWQSGEPAEEEGKLIHWGWYTWGSLPEPLFWPAENFVKEGINPLEFQD